jgi:hypothetical protein
VKSARFFRADCLEKFKPKVVGVVSAIQNERQFQGGITLDFPLRESTCQFGELKENCLSDVKYMV